MRLHALLVVSLLATCPLAQGADANGQFAIKGAGLLSCKDFVQARKDRTPQYLQFGGWMEGYLSATNRYEGDTFDLVPWQSSAVLATWLTSFCERNPEVQFVRAVAALANTLGPTRLTTRSEALGFEGGETTGYIYADTLRRAQQRLVDLGLLKGTVSGSLDEGTRAALRRFQGASALDPTGLPDQATLAKLLQ